MIPQHTANLRYRRAAELKFEINSDDAQCSATTAVTKAIAPCKLVFSDLCYRLLVSLMINQENRLLY